MENTWPKLKFNSIVLGIPLFCAAVSIWILYTSHSITQWVSDRSKEQIAIAFLANDHDPLFAAELSAASTGFMNGLAVFYENRRQELIVNLTTYSLPLGYHSLIITSEPCPPRHPKTKSLAHSKPIPPGEETGDFAGVQIIDYPMSQTIVYLKTPSSKREQLPGKTFVLTTEEATDRSSVTGKDILLCGLIGHHSDYLAH